MASVQIFLSAVSAEFRSYRDALRHDLDRPNVTVKVQEDFVATGTDTLDKLDIYIRQCDAVIHLVGDMTGAAAQPPSVAVIRERYSDFGQRLPVLDAFLQPNAPALSYTQWEAWLALYHRKVLIIAAPAEGAQRDALYRLDETQRAAQQEHLARLASVERYPEIRFTNADRLAVDVLRSSLHGILVTAGSPRQSAGRSSRARAMPRDNNRRYLRGYAFDPHIQVTLEPGAANEIVYSVPLEKLEPGPTGGLIEVIDHDPASGGFYDPVDLEEPSLLMQDGLAPSEGNPQSHQQMVYAIAMSTIGAFEQALGRGVFWSDRVDPASGSCEFVRRLRIYPHALRAPSAYYDSERKALLFGYFTTPARFEPPHVYPDGIVFTCLSHQTVAAETARAILEGMFPSLSHVDSRDMLAFHLALVDLVALLHHLSMPGVLRHVFARAHGDRSPSTLLSEFASQTARASSNPSSGALRDALGAYDPVAGTWTKFAPDTTNLARTAGVADRGAILVAAVFEAFVGCFESRAANLLRDLTQVPTLHEDVAEQLEHQAATAARHTLTMCLRALDYCPPVDVSFGDFLRALVTADTDAVREDRFGYRTIIVDAFRRHGIYPRGINALAVDVLSWARPSERAGTLLQRVLATALAPCADKLAVISEQGDQRLRLYAIVRECSRDLQLALTDFLRGLAGSDTDAVASELGLDGARNFASLSVVAPRLTTRRGHDGAPRVFVPLVQSRREAVSGAIDEDFLFRGGCTLVAKLGSWDLEYIVSKSVRSSARLDESRAYQLGSLSRSSVLAGDV